MKSFHHEREYVMTYLRHASLQTRIHFSIMKKILLMLLSCNIFITSFAQMKNASIMTEKYDFKIIEENPGGVSIKNGDWTIDIYPMPSGTQNEYAPAKDFYMIQKQYHSNGILKQKHKVLGKVLFGKREHYDERGNLIQVIDEDKKFGRIKPQDLVGIIEKVGWINRCTGENVITKTALETNGNFYRTIFYLSNERNLKIEFVPVAYSHDGKELSPPTWFFYYLDGTVRRQYSVDGHTGEYNYSETVEYYDE